MTITLDKFRVRLVNKIIEATSGTDAERYIRTAIRAMQKRKVNGYIVQRFIDCVINQLNLYHFSGMSPVQRNNITFARLELLRVRNLITRPDFLTTQILKQ